ncbi:MAG: DUF5522 domain-containing protein [Saprospiraceae bacterium]
MKTCTNCQTQFSCSVNESCWCSAYPPLLSPSAATSCLCPDCLKTTIKLQTEQHAQAIMQGERENDVPQIAGNSKRLQEGIDFYKEKGLYVFKAWYHLKRGSCCGSGCRHCPYAYKNVTA